VITSCSPARRRSPARGRVSALGQSRRDQGRLRDGALVALTLTPTNKAAMRLMWVSSFVWRSPCSLSSGSSPPLAIVLHPVGRDAERSELKRAFCSSLSEL